MISFFSLISMLCAQVYCKLVLQKLATAPKSQASACVGGCDVCGGCGLLMASQPDYNKNKRKRKE